jgi:hypothetical protein
MGLGAVFGQLTAIPGGLSQQHSFMGAHRVAAQAEEII